MRLAPVFLIAMVTATSVSVGCTTILGDFKDGKGVDGGPSGIGDGAGDTRTSGDGNVASDSSCGDTSTDVKNCGSCGNDGTALPRVATATGVTCSGGQCVIPPSACQQGFAHCTANANAGCETDVGTAMACGDCTTVCTGATGLCEFDPTTMKYGCVSSCSGTTPTLCGTSCTNTMTDPENCSSCGAVCTAPKTACANGACTCPATKPTVCGNACVDTTSDAANCGMCGHSCLGGACMGSACQPFTLFTPTGLQSASGLYAMRTAGTGQPDPILIANCASGADPLLEVDSVAGTVNYGGTSAPSYCGRVMEIYTILNVYYATDTGVAGNGALWTTSFFNGQWGAPVRMDNGLTANVLAISRSDSNYVIFATAATTNNLCELSPTASMAAPTCASVTASNSLGIHGLAADATDNLYVTCPVAEAIVTIPSGALSNQTTWTSGAAVGRPYDIKIPGDTYVYWSDHNNSKLYRSPLTTAAPADLTLQLAHQITDSIDGFIVNTVTNVIYFWGKNSGAIYSIASNGTSTTTTQIATNPTGVGAVTQDAVALYWSVEGSPATVMKLAK